jgi:hypothetical protein
MRNLFLVLMLATGVTAAESEGDIMAKVAANQERAEQMRNSFAYRQNVLIRMHRGNHRLAREEDSDYAVAPTPRGFKKQLLRFVGRYESKGRFVAYEKPHYTYKDLDLDGDLISDLGDDFTNDSESRDGIAADLFPLTAGHQKSYVFRLEGLDAYMGRAVYRITFKPDPSRDEGTPWAGEVLVDANEYQPVLITTRLAKGIPFWVRTVLGTNVKFLGFKLKYERFDGAVWFPTNYSGEFELRAVFFYKRIVSVSLRNSEFRRADVKSSIAFGSEAPSR